ncbi:glucokinase [Rhizobacter sp. Root1221]|uniref:glucokinase n=1 Tax=Rhizobacter sp. Root1221 TaxID=1736433 RepID=UPI000AD508EC|nr:glucokinase [Rhizobacter sp. Root1221]
MNQESTFPRLLGDIGGTNARFAWQASPGAALTDIATYPAADYATVLDAIREYLRAHAKPTPRWCAIGIANPITGDRVQMTNHHWSFSISEVQRAVGLDRFLLINDFTALALSLPALEAGQLRQVGGGQVVDGGPVALVGPGTGLGVSGLLHTGGGVSVPLNGEGGHVTLGGTNDREDAVIASLRRRFGHASAERALSGPGLVNLYEALCELDGVLAKPMTAAALTAASVAGSDPQAAETEALFFSFLGTVAGNLALSLGARGGVYIGGGIVPRLGDRILASAFRNRFEQKGRFQPYLASIPVFVVSAEVSPALIGAARALDVL